MIDVGEPSLLELLPWPTVLNNLRKLTEKAMGNKPVSSVPLQLLLQLLPRPQVALGQGIYHSTGNLTQTDGQRSRRY